MKRLSPISVAALLGLLVCYGNDVFASSQQGIKTKVAVVSNVVKEGLATGVVKLLSKFAGRASVFVHQHRIGAVALGTLGLGVLIERGIRWYKHRRQVEESPDTFKEALNAYIDAYGVYQHNIENILQISFTTVPLLSVLSVLSKKQGFTTIPSLNSVPMKVALENAVRNLNIIQLLGPWGLTACAKLLSFIPLPFGLHEAWVRYRKAWRVLTDVMRRQSVRKEDIDEYESDAHSHIPVGVKSDLLRYCEQLESSGVVPYQKKQSQEKIEWIGDVPRNISELIDEINNPERYKSIGLQLPRGILMLGDPGLGKTFAAQYIRQQTGCEFISIKAPDLIKKYVGDSGRTIKQLYTIAERKAEQSRRPCIIFIDEADAVLGERQGADVDQGHTLVSREILDALFPLMDGDHTAGNVITILASNMPQSFFDNGLTMRTQRITHIINMEYPDEERCLALLRYEANRSPITRILIQDEVLVGIAKNAAERKFTPDNIRGLMQEVVRAIAHNIREGKLADIKSLESDDWKKLLCNHLKCAFETFASRLDRSSRGRHGAAALLPELNNQDMARQPSVVLDQLRSSLGGGGRLSAAQELESLLQTCLPNRGIQTDFAAISPRGRSNSLPSLGHFCQTGLPGLVAGNQERQHSRAVTPFAQISARAQVATP
jgi:SpoVK/Ycf46/Vps4 family AAA+-type ATPase